MDQGKKNYKKSLVNETGMLERKEKQNLEISGNIDFPFAVCNY